MLLKAWLNKATPIERQDVATNAKTSVAYLWQLAGGHRQASASLAERVEKAVQQVTPDRPVGRMEVLYLEDSK